MASSNIKLFDENKGNMLSDSEFSISNQRMNGLQTGVASSQLQNKAMYQASLVAYAIAQVMMQNGKNANDTDAVSAFVSNLSSTMLQKVYDIATTAEAQAGVATGKWMSPALVKTAMNYMLANPVTFGSTVTLARDPTENLQAATKQYVDEIRSFVKVFEDSGVLSKSSTTGFTQNTKIKLSDIYNNPSQYLVKFSLTGTAKLINSSGRHIFISLDYLPMGFSYRIEKQNTISNVNISKTYSYSLYKDFWNDGRKVYFVSGIQDTWPYNTQIASRFACLETVGTIPERLVIKVETDGNKWYLNLNYKIEMYRL